MNAVAKSIWNIKRIQPPLPQVDGHYRIIWKLVSQGDDKWICFSHYVDRKVALKMWKRLLKRNHKFDIEYKFLSNETTVFHLCMLAQSRNQQ